MENHSGFPNDIENPTYGMVEIANKEIMLREAVATGSIKLSDKSISHIQNKTNSKGDVLENAKLSAILAVKKTPELVFMCHPIKITSVKVNFEVNADIVKVEVKVKALDRTGVEIEAMAGVMNALLAIFDLSKRYEKDVQGLYPLAEIFDVKVVNKIKVDTK